MEGGKESACACTLGPTAEPAHSSTDTYTLSLSFSLFLILHSLSHQLSPPSLLPACPPSLLPACPPPPLFPLFLPPCKPHNTLTQRTVGINRRQSGNLKTKQAAGGLAMCKVRGEVGVRVIGEVKGLCVLLPHA